MGCGEHSVELHWFKLSAGDEHRFMNNSLWGCVERCSSRGAINTQCVTCINNGIFYWKINKPVNNSDEIPPWAWLFWLYKKISRRLCASVGGVEKWRGENLLFISMGDLFGAVNLGMSFRWRALVEQTSNYGDRYPWWGWRDVPFWRILILTCPLLKEISSVFLCYWARWINNNEPFPI